MQEKLSQFHVIILLFMTQSGMVIFTLPRLLAQHFGTNGWLAILIFTAIISINILLISAVYRLGKGKSIFEIMEDAIPKIILVPFYFLIVIFWSLLGCLVAKQYVLVFQMIAFPTMNPMLFKLVFDVLLYFLIIKGIYNISKAAFVFFGAIIWMIVLLIYFFNDFQWSRLTPFIFQDSVFSIRGFLDVYSAFLGFELCLLLIPYSNNKTKLARAALIGNLLVSFNYISLALIAFGFYGHAYLKNLQFPLLSMFAYIQLPFIQGTEILFYAFFMFSIIITSAMYMWGAKEFGRRIFSVNEKIIVSSIILLSLCTSFFPKTIGDTEQWLMHLSYMQSILAIALPLGLILLLFINGKRVRSSD